MKRIVFLLAFILCISMSTGCALNSKNNDNNDQTSSVNQEAGDSDTEDSEDTDSPKVVSNSEGVKLEEFGFTVNYDPAVAPTDTINVYKTTDTLHYVIIGYNLKAGDIIHQAWEQLDTKETVEGDLELTTDLPGNYLEFHLTPSEKGFAEGKYRVIVTLGALELKSSTIIVSDK